METPNVGFLKTLLNKALWNQYYSLTKVVRKTMATEEKTIIDAMDALHKVSHSDVLNVHTLRSYIQTSYSKGLSEAQRNAIGNLLDTVEGVDEGTSTAVLHSVLIQHYGSMIAQKLLTEVLTKSTPESMETTLGLVDEYRKLVSYILYDDDISRDVSDTDINELLDTFYREGGVEWFCESLQYALGPMLGGYLGAIVAPTDTGKTALILTIAADIARQGHTVLHINNEEAGSKVKLRLLKHIGKLDDKSILTTPREKLASFMESVRGRYFLYDEIRITPARIEELVKRHKPFLVIVDQASKVAVGDSERDDLKLLSIWTGLREIAKMYDCHIIGVAQAKDYQDTKFLGMQKISGSNIAIQGELDYLLTMNKVWPDKNGEIPPEDVDKRFVTTPKNKCTGNQEFRAIMNIDRQTSTIYQKEQT